MLGRLLNRTADPAFAYTRQAAKPICMHDVNLYVDKGGAQLLGQNHPVMSFSEMQQFAVPADRDADFVVFASG